MPIRLDRFQRAAVTLLSEIASRSPEWDFFSFSGPVTDEDRRRGESFWERPNLHKVSRAGAALRRFDIVHTATSTTQNAAAVTMARWRGRAHHVFTANTQINSSDPLMGHYEKMCKSADTVVAVGEAVAEDLKLQYEVDVDAIIPNGVDAERFDGVRNRELPHGLEQLGEGYFVFVGTVERRKRPDVLAAVAEACPELQFVVAGGQRDAELIAMLEKVRNVTNAGALSRDHLRDLLSRAAGMVFPSDLEGLPLAVIEAMAMGLPVIAQPSSSLPELVVEGETGFLESADNIDGWAARARQVAAWSEEEWSQRASKIRQRAVAKYSFDSIAAEYRKLYTKALRR